MNYFEGASLAPSSIKLFNTRVNKWVDLMPIKDIQYIIMFPLHAFDVLQEYLKKRDEEYETIKKKSNNSTNIHLFISSILAVMKHSSHLLPNIPLLHTYYTLWFDICTNNSKQIVKKRYDNVPTDLQVTKGALNITYEDIVKKRNDPTLNMMNKLLLAMYTDIYPVRLDYYELGIINENEKPFTDNYIILKKDSIELIITTFKTANRYKKIHYPVLPNSLFTLINESLKDIPRKYLFERGDDKPHTQNSFCKWANSQLKIMFNMDITLTFIRHLFLNTVDTNNTSAAELKRIGDLMGHSILTQKLYKWNKD